MDRLWFLIELTKEFGRKLLASPEYIQKHPGAMAWVAFGLLLLAGVLFALNDHPKRSYPPEHKDPPN